jgi:hypothetical protein
MLHKYKRQFRYQQNVFFILIIICLILPSSIYATVSNNTISDIDRFSWSDKIGWINFSPEHGDVHVTDQGLTGYAWSPQYGWINLNPTRGGIKNDGLGHLSGQAWGENTGWIDFSGVSINASGRFTGAATGAIAGTITFDCSQCMVSTDWRPSNSCPVTGSGGGLPIEAFNPPSKPAPSANNPAGKLKVIINNGIANTGDRNVTLDLNAGSDTVNMAISENPAFAGASIEPYKSRKAWTLSSKNGIKTVYVKFYTRWGKASDPVSDTITLAVKSTPVNPGTTSKTNAPTISVKFTKNLKSGNNSNDVRALQQFLNRSGFTVAATGPGSKGKETTTYGAATAKAIMQLQKKYGIKPINGVFGPLTRAKVNALISSGK